METTVIETPRGPLTLRPIQEHEAAALRTLRLEALSDTPEAFGADYAQSAALPPEHWQQRARAGQGNEGQVLFVAEHRDALVGMAGVYLPDNPKSQHMGVLWGVYVQPGWRGLGLGVALSAACIGWAKAQGAVRVKLGVVTTNQAARRAYEKLGFVSYGVEPEAFWVNERYYDLMRMTLDLRPEA
ncbi:MAG TPA: GNAT family N-acetyltransferase [Anaerolineales bacterium]|nr:GNAT family N-acetyltransferase [Anaerolineales bacterium]